MSTISETLSAGQPVRAQLPLAEQFQKLRSRVEGSDLLSSLLAVFDQAMISGTNFVTAVIVGRSCGAEALGLYSLVASALAMVIGVQDQLITAPYVLYHNRKHGRTRQRYAGSILIHQLLFVALMLAGMIACTTGLQQASQTVRVATLILAIATPAILLRAFIREIALAHCDVVTVVLVDAAVCLTQLGTITGLCLTGSMNLPAVYSVLGCSCVLTAAIWLSRNKDRFLCSRRSVLIDWCRNWRFGRWALATHIAGTSTPYLMPWVLFAIHGEKETGYLACGSVIVGIANILLSGMADFLTPRAATAYAEGGVPRLKTILRSMLALSVLAIGSVCVVATLYGEQIINGLYDGRFPGAGHMVALLTLAVLANAVGNVAGNGLWALDRPRANFVADILTLTVAIAAAPPLIGPYGATGAAAATLAASALGAIFRQLIFQQAASEAVHAG